MKENEKEQSFYMYNMSRYGINNANSSDGKSDRFEVKQIELDIEVGDVKKDPSLVGRKYEDLFLISYEKVHAEHPHLHLMDKLGQAYEDSMEQMHKFLDKVEGEGKGKGTDPGKA